MQGAARSYVTAAAALAAGSMIAVTPTVSSWLGNQSRDVKLTSADDVLATTDDFLSNLIGPVGPVFADPLLNLQAGELSANAALVGEEITANNGLVAGEESLLQSLASAFPDQTGTTTDAAAAVISGGFADPILAFERLLDANNLVLGTNENLFNSLIGADNFNPETINASLLLGGAFNTTGVNAAEPALTGGGVATEAPFLSGQIGGVEGVVGNDLAAISNLGAQLGYTLPDAVGMGAIPMLGNALIAFNTDLINDELAFNTNLLSSEVAAETAAFGSNNALNGVVDRVINIDNLPLSTAENAMNSAIGADYDSTLTLSSGVTLPEDVTQSLLTGAPTTVFDSGALGGVEGLFDQNAALLTDIAGLNSAEITSAFAPGVFDAALFSTAISDLIDPTVFSNLAPDIAGEVTTALTTALTSLF